MPYTISDQKFNKHIKEVCRIAGLTEAVVGTIRDPQTNRDTVKKLPRYKFITSHICRRSFASNFYGKIATPYLMSVTGHVTEASLNSYLGKDNGDMAEETFEAYFASSVSSRKKNSSPKMKIV